MARENDIFHPGETVYHGVFGEGVVNDFRPATRPEEDSNRVQVAFTNGDLKWLAAAYANLQRQACPVVDNHVDYVEGKVAGDAATALIPAPLLLEQLPDNPRPSLANGQSATQPAPSRRGLLKIFAGLIASAPVAATLGLELPRSRKRLPVLETRIAGFAYYQGWGSLPRIKPGHGLAFCREPGNEHDTRAIEVFWRGRKLGYIPRSHNAAVSKLMDGRERIEGEITRVLDRPWEPVEFVVYLRV